MLVGRTCDRLDRLHGSHGTEELDLSQVTCPIQSRVLHAQSAQLVQVAVSERLVDVEKNE